MPRCRPPWTRPHPARPRWPCTASAEPEYAAWRGSNPGRCVRGWMRPAFQPDRCALVAVARRLTRRQSAAVAGLGKTPPRPLGWFWLAAGSVPIGCPVGLPARQPSPVDARQLPFSLGWVHGQYRYQSYRVADRGDRTASHACVPLHEVDQRYLTAATAAATSWARDLGQHSGQ